MLTVEEAQAHLLAVQPGPVESVSLSALAGRVLARDVFSPVALPPFRQSSMDGYAIRCEPGRESWALAGETRAGDPPAPLLGLGQARRIFTGAPVPDGADVVVRQEMAERFEAEGDKRVRFTGEHEEPGRFVRGAGSAVEEGAMILPAGTELRPGALGFLAACGIASAEVYRLPVVRILGSGDELIPPGQPLGPGQIYESNTYALEAAVRACGVADVQARCLPDDPDVMAQAVAEDMAAADFLILSGGISVGEHDHVGRVLADAGVETIFYKVAQKPGKPLFFGRRGEQWVFALPGNPASSLVTFWEYARTALRQYMGHAQLGEAALPSELLPLAHALEHRSPRAAFERAFVQDGWVRSLDGQDSYQLRSLAQANALLCLPVGPVAYAEGDLVTVHKLGG